MKNEFFFDKTDLFNRIKRLETILGLNNDFNTDDINIKLNSIEQTLNIINSTYTTKTYVDNNLIAKVNKLGDSLLGNLTLLATPTENNHLVTKQYVANVLADITALDLTLLATKSYVDAIADTKISKFGDIFYGELILSTNATDPLHPITKQQFDVMVSTVAQTGTLDW